jgi:hypothetical protein
MASSACMLVANVPETALIFVFDWIDYRQRCKPANDA